MPSGRVTGGAEGQWLQWGGGPTLTPSFSLRAFYLERSNLPTDASTTAVKIDQVCPTFPHPTVELGQSWGLLGSRCCRRGPGSYCSQNPGKGAPEASGVPPPGISFLGELLPHLRNSSFFPTGFGIPAMALSLLAPSCSPSFTHACL